MPKLLFSVLFLCLFLSLDGQAQNVNSSNLIKQLLDLPAPPPKNPSEESKPKKAEREKEFFADERVPSDEAPIEDLIDYWTNQSRTYNRTQYQINPSKKTIERLLEFCEENPSEIMNYLLLIPPNPELAEKVKKIYDIVKQSGDENNYVRTQVRQWLKYNSKYYLEDLIAEAREVHDLNNYVSNSQQNALRSLAKIDWDSAKTIIDRLENNPAEPYSSILAKWVVYQHAIETGDTSTAERYRGELQKVVENKSATAGQRDLAMDSLVLSGDWEGRDQWYASLLEDETLLDVQDKGYTGLTTLILMSPPGKWTETMIKLTKSSNVSARSAAARNLLKVLGKGDKNILEALLPWLTNPAWAKSSTKDERSNLIEAFSETDFPEAVPGLIWVVQNEKGANRGAAAGALAKYKDARANAALRFALQDEKSSDYVDDIIEALIACGGIGDDEQMMSLEAFATLSSTPGGLEKIENFEEDSYEDVEKSETLKKSLPMPVTIGSYLSRQDEPSDGLAARAIARVKVLRKTKPAVAKILDDIIRKWTGRVIYLETLRQISSGEANVEGILTLLANREDAREKILNDVVALRISNGAARGFGACIAEDAGEFTNILRQADAETQTAMFSCARLIRTRLSVADVAELLKSQDKTLALAAERYLESEDSVEARTLVLARHPNEAFILGARQAFIPAEVKTAYDGPALAALFSSVSDNGYAKVDLSEIKNSEDNLRAEIKENAELIALYALLSDEKVGQEVLRVYKNKIVFTFYEDEARFWEKTLTAAEYESFYQFLLENNVDRMQAINSTYCERCATSEFVMFGRNGGRRVFIRSNAPDPPAFTKIRAFFIGFRAGDAKLRYRLADKIKGLEVLLADEKFNALALWKKDADFRVLIDDRQKAGELQKELEEIDKADNEAAIADDFNPVARQARRQTRSNKIKENLIAQYGWRRMENGKLGGTAAQPSEAAYLPEEIASYSYYGYVPPSRSWLVRAGDSEIQTGDSENGLYKVKSGQNPVKIKEGNYSNPVVSPDGKWVVASVDQNWSQPGGAARINLETGEEFKINVPPAITVYPIAFVSSPNKVLLFRGSGRLYRNGKFNTYMDSNSSKDEINPVDGPKIPEFYLLDVATGAIELAKGEFRPLQEQTYRRLQPTGNANEFWAAIYDEKTKVTAIGRYNDKTFSFQPVIKVPEINLDSMQIWVDEKEAKIYFVYEGHLLALPLKQS
ncbi:MAG TPA: HEAT repeat domain-containing protein [Pyrinomonadaceae bacterium]|jgi:HEAT repeat protein